jgi:hypothetical protein
MSEYQFYEFRAVDRPLTIKQQALLRRYSTRAEISGTRFVNEYHWGDFKGSVDGWMDKYFDVFVYVANWGTHILKLRVPTRLLALSDAHAYCGGDAASARARAGNVILTFTSEDESGDDELDGPGALTSLVAIRDELLRGDRRALYLAWLADIQFSEPEDEDLEPPVPAGLGRLSAAQEALIDFLRIDPALVAAAARASAPARATAPSAKEVRAWLAAKPTTAKDAVLARLLMGDEATAVAARLQQDFEAKRRKTIVRQAAIAVGRRRVRTLLEEAAAIAAKRGQARRRAQ